ncbi:MAG: tRNA pseudouridine(55) synthase TruB, partial [Clostridia bacterium]|nr:tRNA pseudouridine(55) synthase TruB [Clostridia bacterium]
VLPQFIGKQQQVPPNYSAKNVNGVRAYRLARKGEEFMLPAKEVEVFSFDLVAQTDENTFEFTIECSSGTYIRSLARDLGKAVGSSAIMSYLCREKSGIFTLENSRTEEEILAEQENFISYLIPMEEALSALPKRVLNSDEQIILNGIGIPTDVRGKQRVYLSDGTLVGIGECDEEGLLKIKTRLL